MINEHDVINDHTRKKIFRINDHAGKSATILELNSKLNKRTWSFIRYLRVLRIEFLSLHSKVCPQGACALLQFSFSLFQPLRNHEFKFYSTIPNKSARTFILFLKKIPTYTHLFGSIRLLIFRNSSIIEKIFSWFLQEKPWKIYQSLSKWWHNISFHHFLHLSNYFAHICTTFMWEKNAPILLFGSMFSYTFIRFFKKFLTILLIGTVRLFRIVEWRNINLFEVSSLLSDQSIFPSSWSVPTDSDQEAGK